MGFFTEPQISRIGNSVHSTRRNLSQRSLITESADGCLLPGQKPGHRSRGPAGDFRAAAESTPSNPAHPESTYASRLPLEQIFSPLLECGTCLPFFTPFILESPDSWSPVQTVQPPNLELVLPLAAVGTRIERDSESR